MLLRVLRFDQHRFTRSNDKKNIKAMHSATFVIPAKAGIHTTVTKIKKLDSRLLGNDKTL